MLEHLEDEAEMRAIALAAKHDFERINEGRLRKDRIPLPDDELKAISDTLKLNIISIGLIDAIDNWVMETCKDSARAPNDDEWRRIKEGPLDGKIGMSLALQWRYNFGPLFGAQTPEEQIE